MSNGNVKFPDKIRYEYDYDPESRIRYVHGVWGGLNPQGEVEMNFYLESDKLPPYSERLVAPDGSFGHESAPFDEETRTVIRSIHSRLLLNYHTARAVLEWLEDKVEMLEMEEGATPPGYDDDTGLEQ